MSDREKYRTLGTYYLYGQRPATPLFTENETNVARLWRLANVPLYVKDAFHRYLVEGEKDAVNPAQVGTKFTALHSLTLGPGENSRVDLLLSRVPLETPFGASEATS